MKTKPRYDEVAVSRCIELIKSEQVTAYAACKQYGIPLSTIRYRLSSKWTKKLRRGPNTMLTEDEEQHIVQHLKTMHKRGFPLVKELLLHKVKTFFETNSRPNRFINNVPGRKWLLGFLNRHPDITFRTPELLSSICAKVREVDIRCWFANLTSYLRENELMSATVDTTRIYSGDETTLVVPSRANQQHSDGHKNFTVMRAFGADGSVLPPGVVLPAQRFPVGKFPPDWTISKSSDGSLDRASFMLYIRNVFYPHLQKKMVHFPVLYFVDGHTSQAAAEAADLCLNLGIVLIALYPNIVRSAPSEDVAIFGSVKRAWKSAVSDWRREKGREKISPKHFPDVLQKAMNNTGLEDVSIKNGFRVCGLFPFGADEVDYDKCISKYVRENEANPEKSYLYEMLENATLNEPIEEQNAADDDSVAIPASTIQAAIDCIGRERISSFSNGAASSEEGEIIRKLYEMLLMPFDFQNLLSNSSYYIPEENSVVIKQEMGDVDFKSEEPNGDPLSVLSGRNGNGAELLQNPPANPNRSNLKRKFKREFHPVPTHLERPEETSLFEEEKRDEIARKKARGEPERAFMK